jgi:2-polyprenyl-3-methyl-5-hydroxy-6-metoxy-1,4-benzoquinol methylase
MSVQTKYEHTSVMHNMTAPRIIIDKLLEIYKPQHVVDFGCGLGTFLKAFKEKGIQEVLGLDGTWVNRTLLSDFLEPDEFQEADLENKIVLNKKYDLAISLEVAEHLNKDSASIFIENLVNASDIILFSAAIPFQGGQNHVNEQWFAFWQAEFLKHDYVFNDVFRSYLWNNEQVKWWYKQNMFLVTSRKLTSIAFNKNGNDEILNFIHPEHYLLKSHQHLDFRLGKSRPKEYFKLFVKSILFKLNILKK